ncbi:MAG: heme exporter protein CcmD [Proteobacteria bacterium]|nr:heme exporter protein CcmD [Pseudomonadota bacterium]
MTLSTSHLVYILGAYGLSALGLVGLLGWVVFQWKRGT